MTAIRSVVVAGLAATLLAPLTGCTSRTPAPIWVAHIATLSGPDKDAGDSAVHGIRLAVEEINNDLSAGVGRPFKVIHSDARGIISELAFKPNGRIEPHSNPNTSWFIVIEGGGWVIVGEERERVAAGEAVLWPAGILHGAWTDFSEMRAFIVEFGDADDAAARGIIEGRARRELSAGDAAAAADGQLSKPPDLSRERTSAEGEPF